MHILINRVNLILYYIFVLYYDNLILIYYIFVLHIMLYYHIYYISIERRGKNQANG